MGINKLITKEKMFWSFVKFSQQILKENIWRSVREFVSWGLKELTHSHMNCLQFSVKARLAKEMKMWKEKLKEQEREKANGSSQRALPFVDPELHVHVHSVYDSKHVSDMVALKLPEREFIGLLNFVQEGKKACLRD